MRQILNCSTLLALLAIAGCGGASKTATTAPAARAADFPAASGRTAQTLIAGLPKGPIFASSVSLLRVGENRIGFALFTVDHKLVNTAEVALYTSDAQGRGLQGPYPAHSESLVVAPQFQSETVAKDPGAASSVYVAQVPFSRRGRNEVIALSRVGGRLQLAGGSDAMVGQPGGPPDVGQRAISVHTPTVSQVGRANVAQIDTRVPPAPDLQQLDLADVVGRKPVVLLFATPQLCASRVCGPVVDVEEQVKQQFGDRAAFIHMEIYNGNQIARGFRPQVAAYRLPTEPWAFVIDRRGRIAERFEGAFSATELAAAVKRVV
ncbi:MAG: hypothetical protein NVSMB51_02990 [Solirubrobacteraceae bacterium]